MEDLIALNERLLRSKYQHKWDDVLQSLTQKSPVIMATLRASLPEMDACLTNTRKKFSNPPDVADLNGSWLRYIRLSGKDVIGGRTHLLSSLRISMREVTFIANLSSAQIDKLATEWEGSLVVVPDVIANGQDFSDPAAFDWWAAVTPTTFRM